MCQHNLSFFSSTFSFKDCKKFINVGMQSLIEIDKKKIYQMNSTLRGRKLIEFSPEKHFS